MPIIGLVFEKINANKHKLMPAKLNINTNLKLRDARIVTTNFAGNALEIVFDFEVSYGEVAKIEISGRVLYKDDVQKIKEKLEKEKKLPEKADLEIKNFLIRKCLGIAIDLSEKLNLPAPIPFPTLLPKRKDEEKINYIG